MKRAVLIMAAMILAISANAGTITRNFNNLKSFDVINISNAFEAEVIQSDDYSATVTIDTYYEDYLDVSVIGTVLYVRLKDAPRKLRDLTRKTMKVNIFVPSLQKIYLSGTATVRSTDQWTSPMEQFVVNLTGASKAEKLRLSGGALKAEVSGASTLGVTGDFATLDVDISGASAATFSGDAEDITVNATGTSKVTVIGDAESLNSNCAGSSYMDGSSLKVANATIKCSGASKTTIEANESLDVELKGASTCHYRSTNDALKVIPSISRASSFKKIN